jgi:uncharacterized delta-60 repeat protein
MTRFALTLLCLLSTLPALWGQLPRPGSIDTTFHHGLGHNNLKIRQEGFWESGVNNTIKRILIQPDGKILIAGDFTSYNGISASRIARLNTDGTKDPNFYIRTDINNEIHSILLQPDGKVLIGGSFSHLNGHHKIARLNADGTLDDPFDPRIFSDDHVSTIALQPDGRIVAAGNIGLIRLLRYNNDGTSDHSFVPGTGPNGYISTITVQPDGKILIGGTFTSYNGITRNSIARLNADGSLDNSFDPGIGVDGSILTSLLQPDGKILIGGTFTSYNGITRNRIARLNTDGSLDDSFDPGLGADKVVFSFSLQGDGKILIGGDFKNINGISRNSIARLNLDGSLDLEFNPGVGANSTIYTISTQSDGNILAGGGFRSYNGINRSRLARLNSNGSLDTKFITNAGTNNTVIAMEVQPNGKIIIGGEFTLYNDIPRNRIARLNNDGSLDLNFDPGKGANNPLRAIAIQPDGKILIGGTFTTFNDIPRNRIARLNTDGSLDTSFNPGNGASSIIYAIALQPDGKILIGGSFTTFNGIPRNRIARLNTDGSLDTSFNPGNGANNTVHVIALQPDNKILIGGAFSSYNNAGINNIARINADGSRDVSFNRITGTLKTIINISLLPDGKILIGEDFLTRIYRLKPDGSYDSGFSTETFTLNSFFIMPDGKIIVGGNFSFSNDYFSIARLNDNGTIDTSFNTGKGTYFAKNNTIHPVYVVRLQPNGKVLIGGNFTYFDGSPRGNIARIHSEPTEYSTLHGTTYTNTNCVPAASRPFTEIHSTDGEYRTISRADGGYTLRVFDNLAHTFQAVAPRYYSAVCADHTHKFTAFGQTFDHDFVIRQDTACVLLEVELASPFHRRCFDNNRYRVTYRNAGTETATNAYVQVRLHPLLTPVSSTRPWRTCT